MPFRLEPGSFTTSFVTNGVEEYLKEVLRRMETLYVQQQEMISLMRDMNNHQQNALRMTLKNQRDIDQMKQGLEFVDSVFQ